ncbi:MAG: LapA family protein [Burkholderiaceae bacterium]
MPLRTLLLILAFVATAIFLIANWAAIVAPGPVSLVFSDIQAPLGLILVAIAVVLVGLLVLVIVYQQAGVILEARRWHKEIDAQRALADKAEASRFTELQTFLATELAKIDGRDAQQHQALLTRLAALEDAQRGRQDEATNSIAAHVGEVDEKLDRLLKR